MTEGAWLSAIAADGAMVHLQNYPCALSFI